MFGLVIFVPPSASAPCVRGRTTSLRSCQLLQEKITGIRQESEEMEEEESEESEESEAWRKTDLIQSKTYLIESETEAPPALNRCHYHYMLCPNTLKHLLDDSLPSEHEGSTPTSLAALPLVSKSKFRFPVSK